MYLFYCGKYLGNALFGFSLAYLFCMASLMIAGSGAAFTSLADGTGDIGFASRDFNASETESHPEYVTGRICRDAICPIVNNANPLENITVTQLRGIFVNARAFTDSAWAEEQFGTTFEGESAIAAPMPAITQAELDPRPPESGMGESIVM